MGRMAVDSLEQMNRLHSKPVALSVDSMLSSSSVFQTMLQEVIKVIGDYSENNDIFYDDPLSADTQLIADLGLTSVDFVSIFQKCQSLRPDRLSFIELVMPVEGQYVSGLSIGELSEYIIKQSASISPTSTKSSAGSQGQQPKDVEDSKYKRSPFSSIQFEEFKSLIQTPTFSADNTIDTSYKLVFILSSPRSGSTLLQRMLDQHPEIESPEELHLLHYDTYAQRQTALSHAETKHLLGGTVRLRAKVNGISLEDSARLESELVQSETPVISFFKEIEDHFLKEYLVDKTPSYAYSRHTLERITAQFPDAKFIYLVRHPSAVVKSLVDSQLQEIIPFARRYTGDTSAIPEMIWALCHENIQSVLKDIDNSRIHYLNYEDLVTSPDKSMDELLSFLGLPFYASCANPYSAEQSMQIETNEFAGDLKFFLENRIVDNRADIWRSFPALHSLSETSVGLMGNIPGYEVQQ